MKKSKNLKLWIVALLLMPAFLLWKITGSYLFLPIVGAVTESWVNMHYSKLTPSINYSEANRTWEIKTSLFQAEKPWSNNAYSPNLHVTGFTFISIGHMSGATLGLPLFWAFIAVYSLQKLKDGLIGTAVILALICTTIILHAEINIITALNGDSLLRTFKDPYIFTPHKPALEWLWLLKPLRDLSAIFALLVAPILLCYYFSTREKLGGLIKGGMF